MSRSSVRPALVVVAMAGAVWPSAGRAQTGEAAPSEAPTSAAPSPGVYGTDAFKVDPPREVRLPRIEVPDPVNRVRRPDKADRGNLLGQSIELSDERDRRTLAQEQKAWGRLSGTMCVGCGGETRSRGRVATVDPIAVLNAKPATARFAPIRQAAVAPIDRTATASVRIPRAAPGTATAATGPATAGGVAAGSVAAGSVAAGAAVASAGAARVVAQRPVVERPSDTGLLASRPVRARPVGEGPITVVASTQPTGQPGIRSTVAAAPRIVRRRSARPNQGLRARLAYRRAHRSRLTTYIGRVRYAYLRWRHQRPAHRRPPVHR
ncbi:hypothetical protein [Methylobacterium aerolatum]|uniref:Uncharacterized protein n=1 Tax=Methylobacterium aerolatum TaxID=418708 RepID=A0ABU0HZY5_9HYPH|nr:hypothetical protein [Methylobacterium aerolatum]MDQ0447905.1 hypothetical protein [Methylobacterium aerolatum]GJD34388.1 hypothetical protein FMGBMHLM_1287 [Methylobacterium aerolatum]